jgi:hypothetical protein
VAEVALGSNAKNMGLKIREGKNGQISASRHIYGIQDRYHSHGSAMEGFLEKEKSKS